MCMTSLSAKRKRHKQALREWHVCCSFPPSHLPLLPKPKDSNMRKLKIALAVAGLLSASLGAFAQTPPPAEKPAEPPAPEPIFSVGGFDLTGHIDVAYTHLDGLGKFASGVND